MLHNSSRAYVFLFIIVLHISDNISTGDKATNPGPGPGYSNNFYFCYCNLNSIAALNFIKMSLLQLYNSIHRFDIICLSETYLDNS